MEYKTEFTISLPKKLIVALEICEDTLFETYFDDGKIKVRVIEEDDPEDEIDYCDSADESKMCSACPYCCRKCL